MPAPLNFPYISGPGSTPVANYNTLVNYLNQLSVASSSTTGAITPSSITTVGPVLVGNYTVAETSYTTLTPNLQMAGTTGPTAAMLNLRRSADTSGARNILQKSRNITPNANTIVQSGDTLGTVAFVGDDGVIWQSAAFITGEVDGTPGSGDMPGRLRFWTSPDGSGTPSLALTIDSLQNTTAVGRVTAASLTPSGSTAATNGMYLPAANTPSISANSVDVVRFATTASGVNYLQIAPGAAGGAVTLSAQGTDANISIALTPKGAGGVTSGGNAQFNFVNGINGLTGASVVVSGTSVPANGMYLPAANTLGWATNTGLRMTCNATGIFTMNAYGAGAATFDAAGVISSASDERLKNLVAPFTATVEKIKPILYRWKDAPHDTVGIYAGFSAQNVQEAFPEGTGVTPDGFLTLQDRAVLAAAINTINKQGAQIASLQEEIKRMKEVL